MDAFLGLALVTVIGAVVLFFNTLLKKVAEDVYAWLKSKLLPPHAKEPVPQFVPSDYKPTVYAPEDCAWVDALEARDKTAAGWTYYPPLVGGGRCARHPNPSTRPQQVEFLMVRPGASRVDR